MRKTGPHFFAARSRRRYVALDAARGLAVLAMVGFHLTWDLGHFGYIDASIPWSAPFKAFGHAIAFAFLFIAGLSLVLAHQERIHWRAFWRRFAIVAGAAGLVSLGTYLAFPSAFVFFGVLHVIAAASLASLAFLFAPWPASILAGAAVFAAPYFFASPAFNANWLQWLGLGTTEPLTQDWRPFFPWAGAMILGVGAARALLPLPVRRERVGVRDEARFETVAAEGATPDQPPAWLAPQAPDPLPAKGAGRRPFFDGLCGERGLGFLGRHSLLIYLAHQPLLFAVFTALVMVAPPPEDPKAFVAACENGCVAEGASRAYCHDACVCTQQEAERSKALAGVKDEETRGKILREIAGRCVGDK
ncbi:heparan-alpha-glucosaminide N-acetyltransferase domain-containing protein [Methylocystis sp. JAN1]|uniref:heparan-alpha-glucosaminide N-acetyltransferase domain-containing protein n=1 Tax=Methylocystis sp. JAN1 TaxID=3397211 RepID=UPI003FA22CDA